MSLSFEFEGRIYHFAKGASEPARSPKGPSKMKRMKKERGPDK